MTELLIDRALAAQLERTEGRACAGLCDAMARLAGRPARIADFDCTIAIDDGPDSFMTQAFGLGLADSDPLATIDALESFYADSGSPVQVEISPLAGVAVTAELVRRGYRPIEMCAVLLRSLGSISAAPASITARPARADESNIWAATAAAGWAEMGDLTDLMGRLAHAQASRDDTHGFLAFDGEHPVAAGSLFVDGRIALLAGASTIPSARRRGAQAALLSARLDFAARRGAELAMMGAEPGSTSQKNAQKNGFRIAYTRTKWRRD